MSSINPFKFSKSTLLLTPLLGVVGAKLEIIQASCGHHLLKGNFQKVYLLIPLQTLHPYTEES
jgi:hypothetical protein